MLGHLNLDTTRGYTAVFPEEVIAAHQHFIERRQARLAEAQDRAWLGEVAALEESLKHLRQRRAEAESQSAAADAPAR
ncbi:hypothetical protein [Actinopolymorpha pittospori]|uniref:Uncharacterized protein n=1 Tax=Actinopolymorpha pittospori TaxID=648752 RepID=A0A927MXN8_9ACTN|nr:hypothetical protein [Actinopolymorpha pittospori]MBE1608204.1 hypothetical protein [Actinopolymorpha pittospori]